MIRTSHAKNSAIPGMAYPLMVLVLATTASYPPLPDLIDRLTGACCPGGPAAGAGSADGDAAAGVPGDRAGENSQPFLAWHLVAMTGRESGSCGPARLPAGRACHCHAVTAGVAVPALPPGRRRSRDARTPLYARSGSTSSGHSRQRGPAFLKCRARVGTVPGLCATALAGAHLPIASWRIVPRAGTHQGRRPAASRERR
jgi:hypothetical protein